MTRRTAGNWWRLRFPSLFAALILMIAAFGQTPKPGAQQPIPFSHKQHASASLKCVDCHAGADTRDQAGLPAAQKCMQCHVSIKADSPEVQKIRDAAKTGEKIPWVRLYKVPDFVFFSHANHRKAGVECVTCHGPVAERTVLTKELPTNMKFCVDCHKQKNASTSCALCHQLGQ